MCRKCRLSLHEPVPDVAPVAVLPTEPAPVASKELDIAGAVKLLRLCNFMSQRELAVKAGVPRTYISKVESQHRLPGLDNMQAIAKALGADMNSLIQIAAA